MRRLDWPPSSPLKGPPVPWTPADALRTPRVDRAGALPTGRPILGILSLLHLQSSSPHCLILFYLQIPTALPPNNWKTKKDLPILPLKYLSPKLLGWPCCLHRPLFDIVFCLETCSGCLFCHNFASLEKKMRIHNAFFGPVISWAATVDL